MAYVVEVDADLMGSACFELAGGFGDEAVFVMAFDLDMGDGVAAIGADGLTEAVGFVAA